MSKLPKAYVIRIGLRLDQYIRTIEYLEEQKFGDLQRQIFVSSRNLRLSRDFPGKRYSSK